MKRSRILHLLFYPLLVCWMLLHLPFMDADPADFIGPSRDAWTDEGLYTSQVRNQVNYGHFRFEESDALFKTPLFSAMLYVPFRCFGTRLEVARTTVMVVSALIIGLLGYARRYRSYYLLLLVMAGCYGLLFSFAHYAMAEMIGTLLIVAAIHQLWIFGGLQPGAQKIRTVFFACLLVFIAFLVKAMYVYMLAFVPLALLLFLVAAPPGNRLAMLRWVLIAAGFMAAFVLLYYCCWFLPHHAFAQHIFSVESGNRFASPHDFPGTIKFWLLNIYFSPLHRAYTIAAIIAFAGCIALVLRNRRGGFAMMFLPLLAWLLLESHKLLLNVQPPRYQVSLLMAMGCVQALAMLMLWGSQKPWSWIAPVAMLLILGNYSWKYRQMTGVRTYALQLAGRHMAEAGGKGDLAIGPWAPSLTWGTAIYAFPAWHGYMNDSDILQRYNPDFIISEPGERDSESAFSKDGIILEALPRERELHIGEWEVGIYKLKKDER